MIFKTAILLLTGLLITAAFPYIAHAQEPYAIIYIQANGSVTPPDAPILKNGDLYTFIGDIQSVESIWIEKSNITIDGAGHVIHGRGTSSGFNLLQNVSNVVIKNMGIEGFAYGITVKSSNSKVMDSIIRSNLIEGISLWSVSRNNTIEGNNITNNSKNGVYVGGSGNTIRRNNITANLGSRWAAGIVMVGQSDTILENMISANNGYGIYIPSCGHGSTISRNQIKANAGAGIFFHHSANKYVEANNITDNGNGVYFGYSSNNTLLDNNISSNHNHGVFFYYSSNNTLKTNSITDNSGDGVYFGCSSNNVLTDNDIRNNSGGNVHSYLSTNILTPPAVVPSSSDESPPSENTNEPPPSDESPRAGWTETIQLGLTVGKAILIAVVVVVGAYILLTLVERKSRKTADSQQSE